MFYARTGTVTLTGPLSEISIPASLHESLMARLDRLPTLREVAQLGAVLGRDFAGNAEAITALDEPRLRDVLGLLVEAELLYQRGRPPRALHVQACADPGRGLPVASAAHAPAISPPGR
jgi:hypothetical protein